MNTSQTSGANSVNTITLAALGSTRHYIQRLEVFTSGGTAQLTIKDGATTIWVSPAAYVTTTLQSIAPLSPIGPGTPGNAMTVEISAAGGGNTSTINLQHDRLVV